MGKEVVFLCHNSVDHESARWKQLVSSIALSCADRFVVHTQADRQNLEMNYKVPVQVHPHPIFESYPQPDGALPRRASLELLFFGFVRPYKGLDTLLKAMKALREVDVFLSIVGEFWQYESEARRYVYENDLTNRIEFVARYVPDEEAAAYFDRCDLVVLPYHSATGSGVISLAYHYNRPVLGTRTGGLPDVIVDGQTGLLVEPSSSEALAAAIMAVADGRIQFNRQAIEAIKSRLSWAGLAREVLERPNPPL
jgi:glycosyltransferase involved in cell wall biosynthesis